jgi:hypothetical protein
MPKLPWLLLPVVAAVCLYLGARWEKPRGASPAVTPAAKGERACASAERVVVALERALPATDQVSTARPVPIELAVAFFAPQPGETLIDYRERLLPVARDLVAPQRQRVARLREGYTAAARLDEAQRQALDETVEAAGEALKDRILQGVLSGELSSRTKPAAAVAFARDLLDIGAKAEERFRASLRPDQLEALARDRFDLAEYLLFRTRWEDLLGVTE